MSLVAYLVMAMETVSDRELEQKQQLPEINRYSVFDWEIDVSEKSFTTDPMLIKWLLDIEQSSVCFSQLLSLIPFPQQQGLVDVCKKVLKQGGEESFRLCLFPKKSVLSYVEIFVSKRSETVLTGTLHPAISLGSRQELATVFYALFENDHHGILLTDGDTRILACNRYFEKATGYHRNDLVGLKTNIFNADKHSPEYFRSMWQKIGEQGYWSGSILSRRANGSTFPQELTIQKIEMEDGRSYFLGLSVDISEHIGRLDDNVLGGVDLLTQLPTQSVFLKRLESVCEQVEEGRGTLLISMRPEFSENNPRCHKAEFAQQLNQNPLSVLSGYLGESQYVTAVRFVKKSKKPLITTIRQVIAKFFSALKQTCPACYHHLISGVSGVSILGVDAKTPRTMFSHANQAVLAMQAGEGHYIGFYDTRFHRQVERKKQLEEQVRDAVLQKTIEVHFQPIVNIKHWRIEKFESLCRFPTISDPTTNVEELISLAEDMGLINELDTTICQLSVNALPSLKQMFGDVGVTINRSLHTEGSVLEVLTSAAEVIEKTGANPKDITLELTERAYFESEEQCSLALQTLRDEGITIAIDDFGTGYSSFHYLHHCHFDVLKIDRLFVTKLTENSNQYYIVKALADLSHRLDLQVVAEGVETEEELRVLQGLGVDYVQGFLFAPALSLDELNNAELPKRLSQFQGHMGQENSVMKLASPGVKRVDSGEPISTVHQYLQEPFVNQVAVIVDGRCVGLVDRERLNLHLSPTMGTDRESLQEAERWKRSTYQVMYQDFATVNWNLPISNVTELLEEGKSLPWVIEDDHGRFKGVVEESSVLQLILEWRG